MLKILFSLAALAGVSSRSLSAFNYTRFPAGSCKPQSCDVGNPYILNTIPSNPNSLCFRIDPQVCDEMDAMITCCQTLSSRLEKIVLKTHSTCARSVKRVTVDGVTKGGGVYYTSYTGFSELRLTSLRLNASTGVGREICIELQNPCATPALFYDGFYSIYDPYRLKCCPTCTLKPLSTNQAFIVLPKSDIDMDIITNQLCPAFNEVLKVGTEMSTIVACSMLADDTYGGAVSQEAAQNAVEWAEDDPMGFTIHMQLVCGARLLLNGILILADPQTCRSI